MSRGPGVVQRRLQAALEGEPKRRFKIEELAARAFPGEAISRAQLVSVRRALAGLKTESCRAGRSGERGWHYFVARAP